MHMTQIKGIHHVSAITANAAKNLHFYTEILGMRLVKKTVNQDSVSMYHLFYADERGRPGTDFTFFEIPNAGQTYRGSGSISRTGLRVASDQAVDYWYKRLSSYNVNVSQPETVCGRCQLAFEDFEGQRIQLISDQTNSGDPGGIPWSESPVPQEFGITGLGPVRLTVKQAAKTAELLRETLGFVKTGSYEENGRTVEVFSCGNGGAGAEIHLEPSPQEQTEKPGRGSVHHVALRVEDEQSLRHWIDVIDKRGFSHSGFVERYYFKSLYFRDPNGILFELATDGPGFETDESFDELGKNLALPPFLEPRRKEIENNLAPLSFS
ncbi:ring-cleaving dioxygenase [Salisediminibacterium halotolerans]|uniref:ring-cleaving dioxygenase n=1 Tax=Salisediminibacterium halotolerans TaxID=517425 RepID=UPI000EB588BC|nr:ring-cleaving dioxygenase [Salisediminibacterium halotolerans]